jgi:ribosomal protein L34E
MTAAVLEGELVIDVQLLRRVQRKASVPSRGVLVFCARCGTLLGGIDARHCECETPSMLERVVQAARASGHASPAAFRRAFRTAADAEAGRT